MSQWHLRQLGFTNNACTLFTRHLEMIQKSKEIETLNFKLVLLIMLYILLVKMQLKGLLQKRF